MNERLKSIVDLDKYPIHDLNSPIIKNLIKRCKQELDENSCSTIPDFILPKSLEIMNQELEKQLDDVYMSKFDCCEKCYIQFVEGREDRWKTGWRPNEINNTKT